MWTATIPGMKARIWKSDIRVYYRIAQEYMLLRGHSLAAQVSIATGSARTSRVQARARCEVRDGGAHKLCHPVL